MLPNEAAGLSAGDLQEISLVRDAVCDVLWRWGRIGILSGRGLRGGTFDASGPFARDEVDLQLHDVQWTTDTKVSGDLHIEPDSDALKGAITVTTPTATLHLTVQSNLFGDTNVLTVDGNLSGHDIDFLVDAPLGL